MTKFGPLYKTVREKQGVSRASVIAASERPDSALSRTETGALTPSWTVAERMIGALGEIPDALRDRLVRARQTDTKRIAAAEYPPVSEELRAALERTDTVSSVVGAHLNVSQQSLYLWKKGDALPGGDTLLRLVEVL